MKLFHNEITTRNRPMKNYDEREEKYSPKDLQLQRLRNEQKANVCEAGVNKRSKVRLESVIDATALTAVDRNSSDGKK